MKRRLRLHDARWQPTFADRCPSRRSNTTVSRKRPCDLECRFVQNGVLAGMHGQQLTRSLSDRCSGTLSR